MTEAEARSRLSFLVDAAGEPILEEAELDDILLVARVVDRYDQMPYNDVVAGVGPPEVNTLYTPTWDLNLAAAEGWRRKAGKVALHYDLTAAGKTLQRSQRMTACLEMAMVYARKVGIQTVSLRSPLVDNMGLPLV